MTVKGPGILPIVFLLIPWSYCPRRSIFVPSPGKDNHISTVTPFCKYFCHQFLYVFRNWINAYSLMLVMLCLHKICLGGPKHAISTFGRDFFAIYLCHLSIPFDIFDPLFKLFSDTVKCFRYLEKICNSFMRNDMLFISNLGRPRPGFITVLNIGLRPYINRTHGGTLVIKLLFKRINSFRKKHLSCRVLGFLSSNISTFVDCWSSVSRGLFTFLNLCPFYYMTVADIV